MSSTITVGHNFEAAHRLPHLPGKCQSLHGHSWWVDVTVAGDTDDDGVLVEFGTFKSMLRTWIDRHLDHGVILGAEDPLVDVLPKYDTKVHVLPDWPTVENVAAHLAEYAQYVLDSSETPGAVVSHVEVTETRTNKAAWRV